MDNLITIQGILTSRIETKNKDKEPYYYGFFKLADQKQEVPVIFKVLIDEGFLKPNIPKGSPVELTGQWANSNGDRPSFTCVDYKLLSETKIKESEKQAQLEAQFIKEANIYQKLQAIQDQTNPITKTELNKFGNYKYFTEQQALKILKPLLAKQKLTLTFSDEDNRSYLDAEKKADQKEWIVQYLKKAILTNSENPDQQLTFYYWAIGSNTDPAKAKGCAETYAIKYFLTKFFLIPTTDELDPDATKPHEYSNRLANGQQETAEQIQKRHQEKDQRTIANLKQKYGADWKLSNEYKQWMGNLKERSPLGFDKDKEVSHA